MRAFWSVLLLLALIVPSAAQDPGDKPKADPAKKPAAPKEAPAWKLPDKERKKMAGFLSDYLVGSGTYRR